MRYSLILMTLLIISMASLVLAAPPSLTPSHAGSRVPENEQAQASQANITCVFLSSSLPGQSQFLTVSDNVSGALLYPDLSIRLISSSSTPYRIYVNGKEVSSGNVSGIRDVGYNISSGTSKVSITVQLGQKSWNYPNELVSSMPVSKYYGPRPPVAQYTYFQYEEAIVKGFVAALFGVAIAMFSGRRFILEKEKREAIFI
ncbi:MAG: hypothetical protein ACYCUZ_05445 [Cuniculiplasma sp.]|jgi:hypothetical protein